MGLELISRAPPSARRWIASTPVIYLAHDLEELATVRQWVAGHWDRLPPVIADWIGTNTDLTHIYAIAITLIFVAMAAIAIAAASPRASRTMLLVFALTVTIRLGNALLHIGEAAFTRSYVPGLVTAVLLVVPYSIWLVLRLERAALVRHEAVHVLFISGLLLQIPVIAVVLLLATLIAR